MELNREEILELLEDKVGFGAIDLFPNILEDMYGEILEELFPNDKLEDFSVFVTYMPYDEDYPWDIFVKAPGHEDYLYWGDALSTEIVLEYLVNDTDLEIINSLTDYDNDFLTDFLAYAGKEYKVQ